MFNHVEHYAGDPILGLMDKFANDPRTDIKVNLGVGVYYTEDGKLPVLECVKTAEAQIANPPRPRGYLPMDGLAGYKKHAKIYCSAKTAKSSKMDVSPPSQL